MRRFLRNADTPRSQCPEQEEHIYIKLDKDNEVQNTVEEPIAVVKILSRNNLGPWPYIKEHFKFRSKKGLTLSFQSQLCIPATKVVSCTMKSRNGLKSHIQRAHSFRFQLLKKCLEEGIKKVKKRFAGKELSSSFLDNSPSSKKARLKQTLDDAFCPGSKKYKQSIIEHVNDT